MSPFNYGNCNPITYNDPSGMVGEPGDYVQGYKKMLTSESAGKGLKTALTWYGTGFDYDGEGFSENYDKQLSRFEGKGDLPPLARVKIRWLVHAPPRGPNVPS